MAARAATLRASSVRRAAMNGAARQRRAAASGPGASDDGRALVGRVAVPLAVSLVGALMFGYHLAVVNAALDPLAAELGFAADNALKGFVVSSVLGGAFVGSFVGGPVSDSVGRCRAFAACGVPLALGPALCATATSAAGLIAGRFLCGIGIGMSSAVVPVYIAEVAPPALRGTLGAFNQLAICLGILAATVVGLPIGAGDLGWWRTMFWLPVVAGVIKTAGSFVIPESPRWLRKQGRAGDAADAETRLWGAAAADAGDEEGGSEAKAAAEASWGELMSCKRGMLVAPTLFMFQQLSGINAVIFFSSAVFAQAGITSAILASVAVSAMNVVGTIIAGSVIDRAGRKPLLTASFTVMGVAMVILALALSQPALKAVAPALALGGTLLYIFAFGLGVGPVPAMLCAEIFPQSLRGKAMSVSMGSHWGFNVMIGQLFLVAVGAVGVPVVYLFFAAVCAIAAVFTQVYVIETKGADMEEIAAAYRDA